ncbi:MAG: preprotein translocase subunit SecE [Patescibacteria group bacterium]
MSLIDYLRETKGELKHVSWPSRRQTLTFTVIVILISIATAYFLGIFDYVFKIALEKAILK